MKISIMGNYPPPIGGVSIHVKQLSQKLFEENMLEYVYCYSKSDVYNMPSFVKASPTTNKIVLRYSSFSTLYCILKQVIKDKSNIVHFHHLPIWESYSFLFLLFFSKKKLVFTIHDQFQLLLKYPYIFKIGFRILLKFKKRIRWIAVNENVKNQLKNLRIASRNVNLIPAYIGTLNNDTLPDKILSFLSRKSFKISFYAFSNQLENRDVYGVCQVIEMAKLLKMYISDFGLVMIMPNSSELESVLQKKIKESDLESNILIVTSPISSMVPLFKQTDLYLRPTTSDGDSISIREAIDSNCVVIASDAAPRIDSCVIYRLNDNSDFLSAILNVYNNLDQYKQMLNTKKNSSKLNEIMNVYNNFK